MLRTEPLTTASPLGNRSGGASLVVSLETADIRELDHLAELERLGGTMLRGVNLQ